MTTQAFTSDVLSIFRGAFEFDPQAFRAAVDLPYGWVVATAVVLLAGLSEEIGQSVVLFANKVKPGRFGLSLFTGAVLFGFGYLFLVGSTWGIMLLNHAPFVPFQALAIALALSYIPYAFAFLCALPYVGFGIGWIVRAVHLVATVVAVAAVAGVGPFDALIYVGVGWLALSVAQQTLGKPVCLLGEKIASLAAGVSLIPDEQAAVDELSVAPVTIDGEAHGTLAGNITISRPHHSTIWKAVLGVGLIVGAGYVCAVLLAPLHRLAFGWQHDLPHAVQVPLNLLWIGLIGLIVAGFMAPLETLGWWAGWYGEGVKTPLPQTPHRGKRVDGIERYVVYLDGISQSGQKYMPDVETFLDALGKRLPRGMRLVRGIIAYSVINRPLEDDPILSWFWTWLDKLRFANPASLLGMLVNLRNVLIVAVSSDRRYGPIYNYGIGRLVYDALMASGYRKDSGIPITFIGYSGGGQMSAASAAYVKRALDAPVDVISLGGVISGNARILELEHLYHFVGTKDKVERLGPMLFPSRWKLAAMSSWNRARRLGRLSIHSLGPVGHQVPGGMMDPNLRLPDGESALEQTLANVDRVLRGNIEPTGLAVSVVAPNYGRYVEAPFNQPQTFPLGAPVDAALYKPQAEWMGRLILPERDERRDVGGAWFEVHRAPAPCERFVGNRVKLRWSEDPAVSELVRAVKRDVHFSARAEHSSRFDGLIAPVRLDHWQLVDPLESLAGARPFDDVVVALSGPVTVDDGAAVVRIARQPVQISGHYRALMRFVAPGDDGTYDVVHYNRASSGFDGVRERVRLPAVVADTGGRSPSAANGWEHSPLNEDGWYAYGTHDARGTFVVQAVLPRRMLRLAPDRTVATDAAYRYVHKEVWPEILRRKADAFTVQLGDDRWSVGDRALLAHVYGGVGGPRGEKVAAGPVYFGHFAYGFAEVVADEHTGEPRFEFFYEQVYTQNGDGLIAGSLHMSRYLGDRQFGWLGLRPTCNVLLKIDAIAADLAADGGSGRALDALQFQLEAMTARYRTGDGTGCTYVGAANNCAQDSNQALFAALQRFDGSGEDGGPALRALVRDLKRQLQPFGNPRRDWSENVYNLGTTMSEDPLEQLRVGLASWRVLLPRLANDTIVKTFLKNRATGWVIATGQLANEPGVEPVAPTAF